MNFEQWEDQLRRTQRIAGLLRSGKMRTCDVTDDVDTTRVSLKHADDRIASIKRLLARRPSLARLNPNTEVKR